MKKLAIIGASYLQEPLVYKAKEMGIYTICFSWEDGATCKTICDKFYPISIIEKERILEVCQSENIDGIVTIASDVATLTVNYVADKMGLVSNPNSYSEICTNKYKMRNCFLENNIPSPKYYRVQNNKNKIKDCMQFPLIVKPTDRSGSMGVEKVETFKTLEYAIERAQKASFLHEAIVEEYISGREISVESISWEGKHTILQITDKVTTNAPYFVELEHHQPSTLSIEIKNKVKTIVLKALKALNIKYGASHTELKITDANDIYVIEVGARMGGDFIGSNLVQLSTGYDFVKGVIEIALGYFSEPILKENNYSGVYFLSKETEWLKSIIENHHKFTEIIDYRITDNKLKNIKCSGDRSGYLIYKSNKKLEICRTKKY